MAQNTGLARNGSSERRWVLVFAALVAFITTIPYLVSYAAQGADYRFSGFVFGVEDGNTYIAKMLAGWAGAWLFRTPYTAAPQAGIVMYLPYILLGKLAAPPGLHEQLVALLQCFRITAIFLYILATYDFLAFFVSDIRLRRYGLALATLGGGLGWALALAGHTQWFGSLPLDFISPESFGFLSLYGIAHLALARALLLWTLLAYLKASSPLVRGSTLSQALKIGGLWLLAGLAQPLAAPVIAAVIGLHLIALAVVQIVRRQKGLETGWPAWWMSLRLAVLSGILPALFVLYNVWATMTDPFLKSWSAQNILRSPVPLHYLLAYGLLLPFVFLGVRRLLAARPREGWLLVAWVLAAPVLAYAPTSLQRRLPEGIWVALVVLALCWLDRLPASETRQLRRFQLITSLAFPTTLFLLAGGILAAQHPAPPAFLPAAEIATFNALPQDPPTKPGNAPVVLAAYETGNALPAWAPVRVVIGHGSESAGLADLRPQVEAFYSSSTSDSTRLEMVHRLDIRFVFYGPEERALGGWDPRQAAYLRLVTENGDYAAFEVVQ